MLTSNGVVIWHGIELVSPFASPCCSTPSGKVLMEIDLVPDELESLLQVSAMYALGLECPPPFPCILPRNSSEMLRLLVTFHICLFTRLNRKILVAIPSSVRAISAARSSRMLLRNSSATVRLLIKSQQRLRDFVERAAFIPSSVSAMDAAGSWITASCCVSVFAQTCIFSLNRRPSWLFVVSSR